MAGMPAPLGAILAAASLFLLAGSAAAQVVVKIGHAAPTSGPLAHLGRDNENGARMAIDELNAKGIVIDGQPVEFSLVPVDDAGSPAKAASAARYLVNQGVNGVVGHLTSGATIAASPVYARAGIPELSPSATNPAFTQHGLKTAFRITMNDAQLVETIARYVEDNLHPVRVAVIDDSTAYGQGVSSGFTNVLQRELGTVDIVATEHLAAGDADYTDVMERVRAQAPDLIFYGGLDTIAGPLLVQMRQMGVKAKFVGADGICTDALATMVGDAIADGQVLCGEAAAPDGESSSLAAWKAAFREKFGAEMQVYSPYSYDAVMILAEAMRQADSVEPARYLPYLARIKYSGISSQVEFDANGDNIYGLAALFTYRGGKRTLLTYTR